MPVHSKKTLLWRFNVAGNSNTYLGLHVKSPNVTKFGVSWHGLFNIPQYEISRKSSSGSCADTCGETDGRTDITKLIGAFRNRAEAPKNKHLNYYPLYFVRLTELLAVNVVLKIYSTAVISYIFAVSTTIFIITIVATIFYFGVLDWTLWCLIYTNQAENSCFVHNFGFPFFVTC